MVRVKSIQTVLALEAGATRSVVIWADVQGRVLARWEDELDYRSGGGFFWRREGLRYFEKCLGRIRASGRHTLPTIGRIVVCAAGISLQDGALAIRRLLERLCRRKKIRAVIEIYPDIFSTLASELGSAAGIVAVAGTGSCVMGQDHCGMVKRCGGWGALLGDEGSAYAIGRDALKSVVRMNDGLEPVGVLGRVVFKKLSMRTADQVVAWSSRASKSDIAALAPVVLSCARKGDARAREIVGDVAGRIVEHIQPVCRWLKERGAWPAPVILTGGLVERQPAFAASLARDVRRMFSLSSVKIARSIKGKGALALALGRAVVGRFQSGEDFSRPSAFLRRGAALERALSTEMSNVHSARIDTLDSNGIVKIIQEEDALIPRVLASVRRRLALAVDWMAVALSTGGRVFYVGAGTSGRLAALDAAELSPTFGLRKGVVDVIVAGGKAALTRSIEGAEDNGLEAQRQVRKREIGKNDVVVGIAASGSTPFVLSAVREAKRRGAKAVGITCNSGTPLEKLCDLTIAACTGPEVVAGSTRMKAGTATKMILNTLSTAAMIRLGKVYGPWMVDVVANNAKLRQRARRIVQACAGTSPWRAQKLLTRARGNTRAAILMGNKKISLTEALRHLEQTKGNLREALPGVLDE